MVEHKKYRMQEKLRPDENEILDSVLGNGVKGRKTAAISSSPNDINVPSSLRESEQTKIQELARETRPLADMDQLRIQSQTVC